MTLSRRKFLLQSAAATTALALWQGIGTSLTQAADNSLTSVTDTAALMPRHGTVSIQPARNWEDALVAGNGIHGAMLYGDPHSDTLIANHCKLWLPSGEPEILPKPAPSLTEMRRIIAEKGYAYGESYFMDKAQAGGWSGHLIWTDAFHLGLILKLDQPHDGPITNYARREYFSTGEVQVQWHTDEGDFTRRLFVSKPDNVIVVTTTGPRGKVSLRAAMQKVDNDLISAAITHQSGLITCHNTYVKGKGGYDGVVRVLAEGGTQTSDGQSVSVTGADSVTLIIRLLPWKLPKPESDSWITSPDNPEFTPTHAPHYRTAVQVAGKTYDPAWMDATRQDLLSLPSGYPALLRPHAVAWGSVYNRVSLDLGGLPAERGLSSEALLDIAQKEQRLPAALLERMYDAGRYVYFCSAGPATPPNLFGIWTGTWHPAWSGDYTDDPAHFPGANKIVATLIDNVSRNGNLLLNVQLRPDGTLDEAVIRILEDLGDCTSVVGEAIFGTRPWKIAGEGDGRLIGFNEGTEVGLTETDFRFTTKGNTLYATAFGWPANGKLIVRTLSADPQKLAGSIRKVSLLGCAEKLPWVQTDEGLVVTMPAQKPGDYVYSLKIEGLNLAASRPVPPAVRASADGTITLKPQAAQTQGAVHAQNAAVPNLGAWDNPQDTVFWNVRFDAPGTYAIATKVSTGAGATAFVLDAGAGASAPVKVPDTGGWDNYQDITGSMKVAAAGDHLVTVRPADPLTWKPMNLGALTLTRTGD